MPRAWKEWEGRVISKEFRLEEYLGGSERAGVFLTQYGPESRKAAIKLIPIGTWGSATVEAELSRLQSARELSHPHLLQIFQAGRATLDDTELIFVVMEPAEEDLAQILPERALTAGEVREMLKPTLDALGFLHGKGFVHGHLKPANVMAVGDALKLSSDGISRLSDRRGLPGESSDCDAPETAWSENLPASDIWSLGMLLVTALTQRSPSRDASEEPILPGNLPQPFEDIARHCLRTDARTRWSLAEIAARMGFGSLGESAIPARAKAAHAGDSYPVVAKPELRPSGTGARAAAGPQLVEAQRKRASAERDSSYEARSNASEPRSNASAYVAAAVVLVVVAALVVPRLFRSGTSHSPAGTAQKDSTTQERPTTPKQTTSRANSAAAQVNDARARRQALSEAKSTLGGEKPEALSGTRQKTSRQSVTAGQVAEQVVPDVPQSARDTIRGTVHVGVRISVDSLGNVTQADLDSPGPSKYFARLALEAAQRWKFEPPKVEGRGVLSDWLLRFQFTGTGTKVIPEQSDP